MPRLHPLSKLNGLLRLTRSFVRLTGAYDFEYKALFDTVKALSACLCACCNPPVERCIFATRTTAEPIVWLAGCEFIGAVDSQLL